jgi:AraC family transcriptional regulator
MMRRSFHSRSSDGVALDDRSPGTSTKCGEREGESLEVKIVEFPETRVAVVEHLGPPELEHQTALRLVKWRLEMGFPVDRHRNYGVHFTDPRVTPPDQHRVDFCLSVDEEVASNQFGVVTKVIPACRCAVARHLGARVRNDAAIYLLTQWLPASGESLGQFPIFFHYVNVGPSITESEMITDVYLPLQKAD